CNENASSAARLLQRMTEISLIAGFCRLSKCAFCNNNLAVETLVTSQLTNCGQGCLNAQTADTQLPTYIRHHLICRDLRGTQFTSELDASASRDKLGSSE